MHDHNCATTAVFILQLKWMFGNPPPPGPRP